ncbi:helix-turn-helix domain-containing protein [Burkholderia vietnamiensis]|uniref:helix-turn-helix domain-containing protein n=1 Tax=Burkholderia vietnamiensis TaxID=60552 RepID=UPI001CF403E8|nr:helix-turn-helix transcriptional regulator [Burkholderia vietnamiensis]MCA8448914.1 helix-turn-helix domain-containing protein [Burkholderia vietnamiensis]
MLIDETKITTYHTICAVLLRELRVQRGFHRAQFADFFGKPASAWENIETGKSRLDLDILLRVCRGVFVSPGQVLQTADGYDGFLRAQGWSVVLTDVGSAATDGLLQHAKEYWASHGGRFRDGGTILMQPPIMVPPRLDNNMWYGLAPVFQYAVDEQFRALQSDPENFKLPTFNPQAPSPATAEEGDDNVFGRI